MRSFTFLASLALAILPAALAAPVEHAFLPALVGRSPSPFGAGVGVSIGANVAAAKAHIGAKIGSIIHKRQEGCSSCSRQSSNTDGGQEGLLKVLVDLKANIDTQVLTLDSFDASGYNTATLGPILSDIEGSIQVAVSKCNELVGKPNDVILAPIDNSSHMRVTVGQIGSVLAKVIISIATILSKIVIRAGADVCAPYLAAIGVSLRVLVSVCLRLVPGLLRVISPLCERIVPDLKICAWGELIAILGLKA